MANYTIESLETFRYTLDINNMHTYDLVNFINRQLENNAAYKLKKMETINNHPTEPDSAEKRLVMVFQKETILERQYKQ